MTIVGLKTLLELRGISCWSLEQGPQPKKSITVSRSFGKKVTEISQLKEALASYMTCAAAKLRAQHSLAGHIIVYCLTNRYHDPYNYFKSTSCQLPIATDYTPDLIAAAEHCLRELFKKGLIYKKVGVLLADLAPRDFLQMSTIVPVLKNRTKQASCMDVVDRINTKWGRETLFFAAAGIKQPWKMHQAKKSACFTTNWHELLTLTV